MTDQELQTLADLIAYHRGHAKTFGWFIKSLANPQVIEHSNGTGWYQDATLVAARLGNDQHYIKVKR